MAYSAVDPNIDTMNPADRNNAAIKAGYTGYDDYRNNRGSQSTISSAGGGTVAGTNFDDILKRTIAMNQEANKPAVESLEASIPETQAKFTQARTQLEAERDPLKARYENLISQITQKGKVQEQRQSVATSGELGKRGIEMSSTMAQQELANALNPITAETSATLKDVGLSQEADLRSLANQIANLTTGETEAIRNVRSAIAQLQSGGSQAAINNALNLYKMNIDQANIDAEQKWKEKTYNEITLPASQAEVEYKKALTSAKGGDGTTSNPILDVALTKLLEQFGGGKSTGGWYDAKGNAWTDTNKQPVGVVQEGPYKGMTMYRDTKGNVTYGNTKWTYK